MPESTATDRRSAASQDRPRPRPRSRRTLRRIAIVVVTCLVVAGCVVVWFAGAYLGARLDTVDDVDFDRAVHIPPIAESHLENGVRTFDLTMQSGESDLGQRSVTPTWGINGSHLAPTIRAGRGEQVRVRVTNELQQASTLHWHGMHLPAEMDGGPHQMVSPGETWEPEWRIEQPAATLWYHPHPHGATAEHVYRGLAGLFIVDDAIEASLDLPRAYGIDDIPLIVQDRKFHRDGTLDTSTSTMQSTGIIGDTVLVNGTLGPYFEVTTHSVRLRVLNGSNTRPYTFAFEDRRAFSIIGTDGGLLESPVDVRDIHLSPGERAEIVVGFSPGERVRLQSGPSADGDRLAGGEDSLDIMQFRVAEQLGGRADVLPSLVDIPRIDASDAVRTRDFDLSGYSINGETMDMGRIDEVVQVGDTEIWNVTNVDGQTHNFHVHDVRFQIVDIGGQVPPPQLLGWKDTVWIPHGRSVRLVMTFADYTSSEVPYMFHCHMLRHEDQGMMGQFLVVERGRSTDPADYDLGPAHDGHGDG